MNRMEHFTLCVWYQYWETMRYKKLGSEKRLGLYFKTKGLVEHDRIITGCRPPG